MICYNSGSAGNPFGAFGMGSNNASYRGSDEKPD
jgi:hypothetical protein